MTHGRSAGRVDPLIAVWPLFGLVIRTPRLVLTPVRDEHLPDLADAALAGIHDPAVMPFSFPWTDAPRGRLVTGLAAYQWRTRASCTPDNWTISFAVFHEDRLIGVQDVVATNFGLLRQVVSGSWLTRTAQGQGLGWEMRAAVLQVAFDDLGATSAMSAAADWNVASLAVSRKLGYSPNGVALVESRTGEVTREQKLLLAREAFVRPGWTAEVTGLEAARAFLIPDDR